MKMNYKINKEKANSKINFINMCVTFYKIALQIKTISVDQEILPFAITFCML